MKHRRFTTGLGIFLALTVFLRPVPQAQAHSPSQPSPLIQPAQKPHFAQGAWWLEGTGSVLIVASIITLALGYGSFTDADVLQKKNPDGSQDAEAQSLKNTGNVLTTVGWISLGVGAAAIVAGTIWLITDRTRPASSSPAQPDSSPRVALPSSATTLLFDSQHSP